jgi:hypothetical protein
MSEMGTGAKVASPEGWQVSVGREVRAVVGVGGWCGVGWGC